MHDVLKDRLREIALEIPYHHEAPTLLLARTHRRIARNAAVSVVAAAAVVIALIAGVQAFNRPTSTPATPSTWFPAPVAYTVTTSRGTSAEQVYLRDPNGAIRPLTHGPSANQALSWSPDGSGLLVQRTDVATGSGDLFVVHLDGTTDTRITYDRIWEQGASWSPDGRNIVYASDGQLFLVDPAGGLPRRLAPQGHAFAYLRQPAWSPDGTMIAFLAGNGDHQTSSLWRMASDGSGLAELLSWQAGAPTAFAWSPDSTRLAYVGRFATSGYPGVFVLNLTGGVTRLFADSTADWITPAWLPDGSAVVFTTRMDGNQELYAINAEGLALDGSGLTRLTTSRQGETGALFQPRTSASPGTGA